jgi:hypothetical protein
MDLSDVSDEELMNEVTRRFEYGLFVVGRLDILELDVAKRFKEFRNIWGDTVRLLGWVTHYTNLMSSSLMSWHLEEPHDNR